MRHSVITLTMDTYGHLFPGQEADTVARLPNLLSDPLPEAMQATGTYDQTPQPHARRTAHAQRAEGGNRRNTAKRDEPPNVPTSKTTMRTLSPTSCQCPR